VILLRDSDFRKLFPAASLIVGTVDFHWPGSSPGGRIRYAHEPAITENGEAACSLFHRLVAVITSPALSSILRLAPKGTLLDVDRILWSLGYLNGLVVTLWIVGEEVLLHRYLVEFTSLDMQHVGALVYLLEFLLCDLPATQPLRC
jgi:hypothetical protein